MVCLFIGIYSFEIYIAILICGYIDRDSFKNELLNQLKVQCSILVKILEKRRTEVEREIELLSIKQTKNDRIHKIKGNYTKLKLQFKSLQGIKDQLIETIKKNKFSDVINVHNIDGKDDEKDDVKDDDISNTVDSALRKLDTELKDKIKLLIGDDVYKIVDSSKLFDKAVQELLIIGRHKMGPWRPSNVVLDVSHPYKLQVTQFASCLAKDGVSIIIAGGQIKGGNTNQVYKYNTLSESYTKLADMPNKARGFEMVNTPDNKIVIIGDFDHPSQYYVYDEDNNQWETLSLPYKPEWEPQIVFDNDGNLHVAGGREAVRSHYICEWNNKRWLKLKDLPLAIFQGGFCKGPDGQLYLFGGTSDGYKISNSMWIYNVKTKEWKEGPSMPQRRTQFGYVSTNSEIIVCGGGIHCWDCDKSEFNDIFIYDFNKEKWITSDEKLLKPVREFTMTVNKNGEIHGFGGARNRSRINDHFIVK